MRNIWMMTVYFLLYSPQLAFFFYPLNKNTLNTSNKQCSLINKLSFIIVNSCTVESPTYQRKFPSRKNINHKNKSNCFNKMKITIKWYKNKKWAKIWPENKRRRNHQKKNLKIRTLKRKCFKTKRSPKTKSQIKFFSRKNHYKKLKRKNKSKKFVRNFTQKIWSKQQIWSKIWPKKNRWRQNLKPKIFTYQIC